MKKHHVRSSAQNNAPPKFLCRMARNGDVLIKTRVSQRQCLCGDEYALSAHDKAQSAFIITICGQERLWRLK